jgi:hypothetical protein
MCVAKEDPEMGERVGLRLSQDVLPEIATTRNLEYPRAT